MSSTSSEIQYLEAHIGESRIPDIVISSIVCGIATCICVALRFLSRYLNRAGLGKDDYCIIVGLFLYIAYLIFLCIETKYGVGRHILVVTDARMLTILTLCDENIYVVGICFIKFSILLLYRRVFPGNTFRKFLIATGLLVMAWGLAAFFCDTFTCYPIAKQWDSSLEGTCINYGQVTYDIGIANVIIDFILLGLPLPILWKLQMSPRRKVLLFCTLGAGSSACIVSIVRLSYAKDTLSTFDSTWDSVNAAILSGVEMCTAIIACCVATYRPLVERIFSMSSTSKRASQENSEASGHRVWGKISVQHDIDIEMGSRAQMTSSPDADSEAKTLKHSNALGAAAAPGQQPAIHSERWAKSPSQSWQVDVTTNGSGALH